MRHCISATIFTFLATVSLNTVSGHESFVSISNSSTPYNGNVMLSDLDRGLTPHFNDWLNNNGYGHWGFQRLDLVGGAYGGKSSDSD